MGAAANCGFEWLRYVGTQRQIGVSNGALPEWAQAFLAHSLLKSQLGARENLIFPQIDACQLSVPQQTLLKMK